jgi:hypothetical protein
VLSGKRDKSIATVANLLLNTRLRTVELERRWKEIQELEGRLEALEGCSREDEGGMRKDTLEKLYDRLTPEERFRLVIEAETRGDEEEFGRLVRSAPRYTYTEADPAYTNLVRASQTVTWAVCLDLVPRLAKMQMIAALRDAYPHLQRLRKQSN